MISKALTKSGRKRVRTWLMVILFFVMFAANILGCLQAPVSIPAELSGTYKTTHREYDDQFFKLDSKLVTLGFGAGIYKYYNVKKVEKEIIDNRTLYTILCANPDQGEEFNFAFFVDFAGDVIIHFKNKPKVAWQKQVQKTSYNENLDKQS